MKYLIKYPSFIKEWQIRPAVKGILFLSFFFLCSFHCGAQSIVANPINLNYRFQFDNPGYREAADPVCEYFKGKYYLFASKSGGYWSSPDLAEWTYIPCTTIATQENYAPTILALNDTLYHLTSGTSRIFYTTNPDADEWKELVPSRFEYPNTDPAFFRDEDTGKVYIFWGCSDKDPIKGVEVDPHNGFKSIGTPKTVIEHKGDEYGWEVPGNNNEEKQRTGWNEGPCMIKYNGKYYLQYAAPGTEYRIYGDGIYVGDSPLGTFTYMENNPFSIKPGGFIGGAGHGHTFGDKYGNYWHVASMKISKRHMFERRLGLFPVYFDEKNTMYAHTVWTDYPFRIPNQKTDFATDNLSMNWNLLSYKKPVSASSSLSPLFIPGNANNEEVENWWSAQSGNAGEWWQVDLGKAMQVNAIQLNFADQDFTTRAPHSYVFYQYYVEISDDGEKWTQVIDRTQNTLDSPHELIVLDESQQTRYLRITNTKTLDGEFSIAGFRVFGKNNGELPKEVSGFQAKRQSGDRRRFLLNWDKQDNTTGYIVHWGVKENQLNHAIMVFTNQLEAGFFNRDSPYYFSVDAFNETGVTGGTSVTEGNVFLGSPYGGIPGEAPGTIEAEDFNVGGQGFAYYDTSSGNSFLEYRKAEDVDIDYYRRTEAYFLANTETGEYTNYTIQVQESGLYAFDCICISAQANKEGGFYLNFDGEKLINPAIQTLPAGNKTDFHTTTLPDISLVQGAHVMTFNIQGDVYVDKFTFRKTGTGIQFPSRASVSVYPNPSTGIFGINAPQTGDLAVCDIAGRKVYRDKMIHSSCTLDLTNEPEGIYLLSLRTDDRIYRNKLIKN
jgi:hypothetical protein